MNDASAARSAASSRTVPCRHFTVHAFARAPAWRRQLRRWIGLQATENAPPERSLLYASAVHPRTVKIASAESSGRRWQSRPQSTTLMPWMPNIAAWFAVLLGLSGSCAPSNVIDGTPILGLSAKRSSSGERVGSPAADPKQEAIAVDHHIDEVRVVEGGRRPLEEVAIKLPARRPLPPKDAAQVATMPRQAFASSLQLKQMLIPEHLLQSRGKGSVPVAPRR